MTTNNIRMFCLQKLGVAPRKVSKEDISLKVFTKRHSFFSIKNNSVIPKQTGRFPGTWFSD
jgi:hypothetical protein